MTTPSNTELRKAIAAILHKPEGEGALLVTSLEMAELVDKDKLNQLEALFQVQKNQLLTEIVEKLPVKMSKRYSSRDVAVNSTGWEVGELDAYDTALDEVTALIEQYITEGGK